MPDTKLPANINPNTIQMRDLLGATYSIKLESCLSVDDFLEQIRLTTDMPSSVIAVGEIPGGKVFKGFVNGRHFSLKKKVFGPPGQYLRELQGRVSDFKQGSKKQTLIELRFVEAPSIALGKYLTFAGFGLIATLLALHYMFNFSVVSTQAWILALCVLGLVHYWRSAARQLSFGHEEEMLDHVKKIAAGVVPNPDSIIR